MNAHAEAHPLAGQTVTIAKGHLKGESYVIEDWWDRVSGQSWMDCDGNPACLEYAVRSYSAPLDDEVVYGKIGPFGKLVHVTDLPDSGAAA